MKRKAAYTSVCDRQMNAQTGDRIYIGLTKNLEELNDELSVHYI